MDDSSGGTEKKLGYVYVQYSLSRQNPKLSTGKRFGMLRDHWKPREALSLIDTNYQHIHISYL